MGIVASRRKRRALNRQLSVLATGYFTKRQITEFRNALGPDPIHYTKLFKFLDATALGERLQRRIVRQCSHGDSDELLTFADFLNARVALEQRYGDEALVFCRNFLLSPSGQLDTEALADCVKVSSHGPCQTPHAIHIHAEPALNSPFTPSVRQFAAGGPTVCSQDAATVVADALTKPTKEANMAPGDAVDDIFERCPALLKLIMRMLADAAHLPWVPPPQMHTLNTASAKDQASPADERENATARKASSILTVSFPRAATVPRAFMHTNGRTLSCLPLQCWTIPCWDATQEFIA